ncbi:MAG: toll/interleukin-1 receptor domain-containing protein [Bacteroidota bacterium]|jgi:hypothetical protein
MEYREWKDNDWQTLIYAIKNGNCILMLGPEASFEREGDLTRPLTEVLAKKLVASDESGESRTAIEKWKVDLTNLAQVALCLITEGVKAHEELMPAVVDFYTARRKDTSEFHRDLAALPFYLTIVSTPDSLMYQSFKNAGKNPIVKWYNLHGPQPDSIPEGTKQQPLVFHLYGSVDDSVSLVLSEDDLIDFLMKVGSSRPSLPRNLLEEIRRKEKSFLFLGFGFKHWYLRVLLHVLALHKKEGRSFALEQFLPDRRVSEEDRVYFYNSDYKIKICDKNLEVFAKELRRQYELKHKEDQGAELQSAQPALRKGVVFICHASENKDNAANLYDQLEKAGLQPWLDRKNLEGGGRWRAEIEKAIQGGIDHFVVIQSTALVEKVEGFVNTEINWALDRQLKVRKSSNKKFIIPVRIDDSLLIPELSEYQAIDLRGEGGMDDLISSIKRDQQR